MTRMSGLGHIYDVCLRVLYPHRCLVFGVPPRTRWKVWNRSSRPLLQPSECSHLPSVLCPVAGSGNHLSFSRLLCWHRKSSWWHTWLYTLQVTAGQSEPQAWSNAAGRCHHCLTFTCQEDGEAGKLCTELHQNRTCHEVNPSLSRQPATSHGQMGKKKTTTI